MTIFATINLASLSVAFHRSLEVAEARADRFEHMLVAEPDDLKDLSGSQLVSLYNDTADEIGENLAHVNKFANKDAAARRTWANLVDLQAKMAKVGQSGAEVLAATKKELWRRPKHERPAAVAYRPKPDSVQGGLYTLLTQDPPLTMEEYCARAATLETRDRGLFNPPQVWGSMRYLFVTKRGYGLDFDGTHIKLVVPADERGGEDV